MRYLRCPTLIVAFLLILIQLFSLSGCHGSIGLDPFVLPEEFDTTRNYEISFWAKNDTNIQQTKIYKKAIEDFEAIYPNIKVNIKLYTDYGKIYNDVITNIATQTTPNICITYPDHIATYLTSANTVVPLDIIIDDEEYGLGGSLVGFDSPTKEEIIPKFLGECTFSGHTYAMPYMRSTEACYINKTYLEKLGYTLPDELTWDFIWEVSEAAMKQDADGNYLVNGKNVMMPFIYKSTDNMMIQMLRQLDAGYSNENGEILIFNDQTKGILETIAKYTGVKAFNTFKISGYPANYLNAGQCIFAIDSTAGATWMGSNAPLMDISEENIVEFETEVMMIPQFNPSNPKMISQGPSICIFNKTDPHEVVASWLFCQYLLTNEVQIAYSNTEGYVPVTSKAQNSTEYRNYLSRIGEDNELHYDVKLKATNLLLDNIDNTFVTPVFNGSASLRDASGQLIENTTKSVMRKETVDDAYFEKLYSDVRSLFRLDQIRSGSSDSAEKAERGKLPTESVVLISALVVAWVLIGLYVLFQNRKKFKNKS